MVKKIVTQVCAGDKLADKVETAAGNTLFDKGRILNERDIEILQAFLVPFVMVDQPSSKAEQEEAKQEEDPAKPAVNESFQNGYERLIEQLRKTFKMAGSADGLPIMELRNGLESLIADIQYYNLLTYQPRYTRWEDFIYHNGVLCALTSYQLATWAGLPQKDWIPAALAGLLHDLGNYAVDSELLVKPAKLTRDEMEDVKKHTIIGYNRLKGVMGINEGVKLACLQHHEREDGSGYPLGISSDTIHVYAKIVAIADVFHAMCSPRRYKKSCSAYMVLEQLQNDAFGKLNPSLVQSFIYKVTQFQLGTLVRLSNGMLGEIVFSDRNYLTRPWVNANGKIINLALERNLHIQDIIT